jgi:FkbM family methyltransferase
MKIWGGVPLENALRAARDKYFIGPLARSRWVQRHAHFGYDYSVKVMGDHMIAYDPKDRGAIGADLMRYGEWFREDFCAVLSMLASQGRTTKNKVFVDVGANIGTQIVYALIGNDFARAIAIEPEPTNLSILNINILLNRLTDRVNVVKCAAGSRREQRSLTIYRNSSGRHTLLSDLIPLREQGGTIDVDVVPVDTILQQQNIRPCDVGLVLLDVEGFEPDVLAGLPQILEARVPLFMEFNSNVYGEAETTNLFERLSKYYSLAFSPGLRGLPAQIFDVSKIDKFYLPGDLLFL